MSTYESGRSSQEPLCRFLSSILGRGASPDDLTAGAIRTSVRGLMSEGRDARFLGTYLADVLNGETPALSRAEAQDLSKYAERLSSSVLREFAQAWLYAASDKKPPRDVA